MRTIGFIEHSAYKITVFSWSEKYIVKIEAGYFEQSYKFRQDDFSSWEDLKLLFDDLFIESIRKTFHQMAGELKTAKQRYEQKPRIV